MVAPAAPTKSPRPRDRGLRPRLDGVIELEEIDGLVDPVVIAAFEGWNDAADAASSVVDHLMRVWNARIVGAIDPDEFYDFQVNRPMVGTDRPDTGGSPGPAPRSRSPRRPTSTATSSCCAASSRT